MTGTLTPTRADRFDVAVIGGGAAGLSAALTLARTRRAVIMFDAGSPRNAPAVNADLIAEETRTAVAARRASRPVAAERATRRAS